jgi:hypothetical protein
MTAAIAQFTDAAPYVTSIDEILWGVILVAISLLMHGSGMIATLRFSAEFKGRFERVPSFSMGITNLVLASWIILAVHLSEVMVWAAFFQWEHCFVNYSTAMYFALSDYTTLGSDLSLPRNWRLLSGMLATAGLLGFAWSCGVLLTLAQTFQDNQLKLLEARRAKRTAD